MSPEFTIEIDKKALVNKIRTRQHMLIQNSIRALAAGDCGCIGTCCEDECCTSGPPCPSDCTDCTALTATISGGTGCCCVVVNVTDESLGKSGCTWSATWFDPVTFADARMDITCDGDTNEWVYTVEITSADSGCSPTTCNQDPNDTWEGRQDASPCPYVAGLSLPHIIGADCSGTLTLTVA